MRNEWLSIIIGKKSIRMEMFWYLVFSLLFALAATMVTANYVNQSANAYQFFYVPIIVFAGVFFVSFYLFTWRLVRYLVTISDGLVHIADGNLRYRVPILREDELGKLAANINNMAEQLQRMIQKERDVEKSKMDLITGVSHDLRTPLTSIIGYLDLLKNKSYQSQAEQERFIQNTFSKATQLKKLIDDLFEYTRLTSGHLKLNLQKVDIRDLISQMLFEFEPIAQENGVSLQRELGEEQICAYIDNEKFVRAIDNLLMNALKFSIKPGIIDVSLNRQNDHLLIAIQNEGRPISEEQAAQLFDRFYKVDESRSGQSIQTGAGLGLSITKNIVEQHGGSIRLAHSSGHFAFIVEIPIKDEVN